MTNPKRKPTFSRKTQDYLTKLEAVDHVTDSRIYYTDKFREHAMLAYDSGGSPVEIFRQAGLDPDIIGRKRIERCFSRWRDRQRTVTPGLPPLVPDHHRKRDITGFTRFTGITSITPSISQDAPASTEASEADAIARISELERMIQERDRLIASQALRIASLEAEVGRLMRIAIDHAEAETTDEEASDDR